MADFSGIVMRGWSVSWQSSNDWVMSGLISDCAIVMVGFMHWLSDIVMAAVVVGLVRVAWFLLVVVVGFLVSIVMSFLVMSVFMGHIVRLFVISMMLRRSMMSAINFVPVFTLRLNLVMLDMVHVLTMVVVVRFTFVMGSRFVMSSCLTMVINCFRVGVQMQVGNVFDMLIAVVLLLVFVGEGVVLVPVIVVSAADPSGDLVLWMSHFLDVMVD